MSRILAWMALAGAGLLLFGCGQVSSQWTGVWEGERRGLTLPEKEDEIARQLRRVKFVITPDGRFERLESGITGTGSGRFGEKVAYLRLETLLDKPIDSDPNIARENADLVLELMPDGSIDYRDPTAFTQAAVRLTRTGPAPQKGR